jgi:hypothetical protein
VKLAAVLVPVPVRVTVCGLVESASVMTRLAVSATAAEGLNVTLIVQDAPAGMLGLHVFDADAKSVFAPAGTPPETTTLVNAIAAAELLVSVTVFAAEAVPTNWKPNARLAGDTVSVF